MPPVPAGRVGKAGLTLAAKYGLFNASTAFRRRPLSEGENMDRLDYLPVSAQEGWKALYRAFRIVNREEGDWHPDAVTVRAIALAVELGEVHAGFALRAGRALASMAWEHVTPPRPLSRIEWRAAVYRLKAADGRVPIRGPRPWWK